MRTFYEEWRVFDTKLSATTDDTNLAATTAKSKTNDNLAVATAKINPDEQLMVMPLTEVPVAAFFSIGFTHHITILSKVKTQEERYYYIQLCHNMSLTVDELELRISENAYAHRGQMPNNFNHAIADYKQAFRAIQMFKDEYLLDYINVEQLGIRDEDLDETVIENEIVHNVMARMGDKELWQFLRERHAIDEPLKVQSIEKAQRNDIILSCLDKGAGLRQLSRITGVTYGVIYRLQGRR